MKEKFTKENLKAVETATANLQKSLDEVMKEYCSKNFDDFREKTNKIPDIFIKQLGELRILYLKASKEYGSAVEKYNNDSSDLFKEERNMNKLRETNNLRSRLYACTGMLLRSKSEIEMLDEAMRHAKEYEWFKGMVDRENGRKSWKEG